MLTIARGELIQIFRNRLVLVTALVLPAALSAFFITKRDDFTEMGSLGYLATLVLFFVASIGLYTTSVTTLAARRQNLFLKRLRSTAAGDAGILAGLLLPITVLSVVQIAVILGALAAVAGTPADPLLLVAAAVSVVAMMAALGLATAGLTNSPEHAQVTTLPGSVGVLAVSGWVGLTGTGDLTLLKRLLPGGSATELVLNAWNGGVPLADSLVLFGPTLAWVVVAVALATRLFRWEPRR
ncbi:ABC transporter permease [Amycolatopsis sp.]|uniref:ABC transporter permease n=1 Tax=Amycolatopsis sp. TaxID=37632 RepID=UPI002D80C852|nr:ABC transporter permease [Amycolatopsis sp.]HET6707266.1 ABC transporter permease [Amycolatopsis sp.]